MQHCWGCCFKREDQMDLESFRKDLNLSPLKCLNFDFYGYRKTNRLWKEDRYR